MYASVMLQNHRLTGTGGHLQSPAQIRVTYRRLLRTMSTWLLNIFEDGDSIASMGNLCQSSATLIIIKCFLMVKWDFLYVSLCRLPLDPSLGTTKKSLPVFFTSPVRYLYTLISVKSLADIKINNIHRSPLSTEPIILS